MAQSIVYLHGVPESGEMWQPFLDRTGGDAPDLPGFGRSDKPSDGDYSFRALGRWVSERTAALDRFSLVMHDWGAVGLLAAIERPAAIERLVLIDAVPLLPGYRWHGIARVWRTPVVGEVFMGLATKRSSKRLAKRQAPVELPDAVLDEAVEQAWKHFDHGTQRAILRLYRSAGEPLLAQAGKELGRIGAPALVVHGAQDPYIPAEFARAYADALGGPAELELVDGAGHWPWYEQPRVIDRVAAFLAG
jgi:pimeloyl-ACP methyl ester carboxylesterase